MTFNFRQHEREKGQYDKETTDQIIDKIILVSRTDLQEVYEFIGDNIDDKSIAPTAFWSWINTTAINAIKHNTKWYHYLSMNGSLAGISIKSKMKITEWLLRSDIGFDYLAFKKCQDTEKESDLRNERIKHIV